MSVPATERAFTEVPPTRLYLDTSVLLDYFVSASPTHARVRAFAVHLQSYHLTSIYLSSLSWLEIVNAVRRLNFRNALPAEWQQEYQLNRWQNPWVRQRYFQAWLGLLDGLLAQFEWIELAITPAVRVRALDYVSIYNLKPQDAAHLACANNAGVVDLASFDEDFRRVDGLHLWNDKIHTTSVR
jgi:predicted nucleic acid-binding protein